MTISAPKRPTQADINLATLVSNFENVREMIGRDTKYMAVVKADAYGHGSIKCARALEAAGIDWFGVAIPAEGVELRKKGIRKRILCLGSFWRGQEKVLLNHSLTPVIFRMDQAEAFNAAAKKRNSIADVHLKIDTGMGRIGVRHDELDSFLDKFEECKNLHVEGVMTHFAAADDPGAEAFTNGQITRFEKSVSVLESHGFRPVYKDLANSPGAVAYPRARGNLVRLGGILYGLTGDTMPPDANLPELEPVMSIRAKVAHVKTVPAGEALGYGRTFVTKRESRIATLPIGYQDGYPRLVSNRGKVIIRGGFAPVVGRVSMDWTLIDVTDLEEVSVGDEAVLIGSDGDLSVRAEDLAKWSDTISYEITCGINRRVTRVYVEGGKE